MIRILLVDDQQNIRRGLRMRLGLEPDLTVVGEAGDGEAALRLARLIAPDVVVMDVEMPGVDGIAATEMLLRAEPRCAVVVLTLHDDAVTRERAAAAGACGFVSKTRIDDCLLSAIRAAASPEGQPFECTDTA
jgi:DNA-binding NarL/FixJ family response regulator